MPRTKILYTFLSIDVAEKFMDWMASNHHHINIWMNDLILETNLDNQDLMKQIHHQAMGFEEGFKQGLKMGCELV